MEDDKQLSVVESVNIEINRELTEKTASALLATTFKGLNAPVMKQAMMEGMIRGFKFQDFLEKNVYAIPFKDGYSLVTSIDYSRKMGMKSGIVGVDAPIYEMDQDGKKIVSCTVTVKRKIGEYVGDYTATVYFDEYYKSNQYKSSLWDTKPRTMIAKVAEMHALRKACPEELSQSYVEEEMELENSGKRINAVKDMVEHNPLKMGNFSKAHENEPEIQVVEENQIIDAVPVTEGPQKTGEK